MKKLLPILLCLILLLSACAKGGGESVQTGQVQIYRVLAPEYQTSGELIEAVSVPIAQGETSLETAAKALMDSQTGDRLKSPLPAGVRIINAEQSGDKVKLTLTNAYAGISGMDKTIMDSCITLTFSSLEGAESVSIYVSGNELESGLRADDLLLENSVRSEDRTEVRLYFPGNHRLRCEYRSLSFSDESSAERLVAEALMAGPQNEKLSSALPAGTVLLSVYTQEGICTVSLSEEFSAACEETPENASLWVYSVVNTLCSLQSVDSVQLLVEGGAQVNLGNCDVSHPLTKNEKLIGSPVI